MTLRHLSPLDVLALPTLPTQLDDWGLISEAHDESEDWGLVTEAVDEEDDLLGADHRVTNLAPAPSL